MKTWTKELPTEAGWYWWREDANAPEDEYEIHKLMFVDGVLFDLHEYSIHRERHNYPGETRGEWGPRIPSAEDVTTLEAAQQGCEAIDLSEHFPNGWEEKIKDEYDFRTFIKDGTGLMEIWKKDKS